MRKFNFWKRLFSTLLLIANKMATKYRTRQFERDPPGYCLYVYSGTVMFTTKWFPLIMYNPIITLYNRGDKEAEPITGPPSSCKELSQLGHTLNGIYLVRINSTSSNNTKIINAVFCDFQPNFRAHHKQPTSR